MPVLVVEVVSFKGSARIVHTHELDEPTRAYAPAGTFRHELQRPVPFEITLVSPPPLHQPRLPGPRRDFHAVAGGQFRLHVAEVGLHRAQ